MRSLMMVALLTGLCHATAQAQNTTNFAHLGEIVRLDSKLDELLPKDAKIELLGAGFEWTEGPVWVPEGKSGYVLFSDIPHNSIMKWEYGKGVSLFMKPSGYTGVVDYGNEPGCNGLVLDPKGQLVACEHGDRRVSVLTKNGGKRTIVDNYQGKRLNSPNDACFKSNGDLYFTDPPYGLPGNFDDPRRELDFCGVYRVQFGADGVNKVTLLTDQMTRPNGIAFSPDEKFLYVAQSDPKAAVWMKYPVKDDGTIGAGTVFFDSTQYVGKHKGLPDGLKTDKAGNVWATGPGGVWIFDPSGKPLGRIDTKEATANCCWGDDGTVLYITADMYFCRVKTTTKGW
jgi:gluconolactonase